LDETLSAAVMCARKAREKKADDIVVLDLRGLTDVTDFFVIASVGERQGKAVAEEIMKEMKEAGRKRFGVEGSVRDGWLLLDYVDVVVHLFEPDAREYYDLENLWGDAPRVEWEEEGV